MIVGLQPAALFGEDELDINVRKRLQVQLVQLRGQLRLGQGVDDFRRTIDEAMEGGDTCFVINLDEISMIDSSGIGLLVRYLAA
jgi:anti-anti-sigma factor